MSEIDVTDDGYDQERIDKIIWREMGVSPTRVIAEKTGLKPEQVHKRKRELIEDIDELTIQQERSRAMVELKAMARDARKRADSALDEFYSGMLNSSIAALKTMLAELGRLEKQDNSRVDELNAMRLKEILRMIDVIVRVSVAEIATRYDLPEADLMEVFERRMLAEAEAIEAVEA